MPLRSMTGFGDVEHTAAGWRVHIELKAVNQRGFDARIHTPRDWGQLEPRLLKALKRHISRGRLSVHVGIERAEHAPQELGIDELAFGAIAAELKRLALAHGLHTQVCLQDVLEFKPLFMGQHTSRDTLALSVIDEAIAQAIARFDTTRLEEGATLRQDLQQHLDHLIHHLHSVRQLRPALVEGYRGRLTERLAELERLHGLELEESRVAQEVVLFADRSDISEELQRAGAHLDRLADFLRDPGPGPHGKKLDFYLQEMIRETNTMASKSNFAELTEVVVDMKSRIEQMREQAANIE